MIECDQDELVFSWGPQGGQSLKYVNNLQDPSGLRSPDQIIRARPSSTATEVMHYSNSSQSSDHIDSAITYQQLPSQMAIPETSDDLLNKQILIVDDMSFNVDALMIILKTVMKLDTAKLCSFSFSGKDAINKVKASTDLHGGTKCGFKLIFMDANMPVIDGYEATKRIREYLFQKGVKQPIITAVTGHTERIYVKQAIDSGMN